MYFVWRVLEVDLVSAASICVVFGMKGAIASSYSTFTYTAQFASKEPKNAIVSLLFFVIDDSCLASSKQSEEE